MQVTANSITFNPHDPAEVDNVIAFIAILKGAPVPSAAPAAAILVPNTGAAPAPSAGPVGAPAPQAQASVELIGFPAGSVLESRGNAFGSPPTVKTPAGVVQASWVQQADGALALTPYSPAPSNNDPAAQAAGDAAVAVETAGAKAAAGG